MSWIINIVKKFIAMLGVNPWFTHDKWCHGWIHTITTAFCVHRLNMPRGESMLRMWLYGIGVAYEVLDLFFHCVVFKDQKFKDYYKDSLKDICWNTLGCLIGGML